jgi:hypothetical protein
MSFLKGHGPEEAIATRFLIGTLNELKSQPFLRLAF